MSDTHANKSLLTYAELKNRQRMIRETFSRALGLRVHRAISWFGRAEKEVDDPDARFIFLWIAFNAAYASDLPDKRWLTEKGHFSKFIDRLVELDKEKRLAALVWEEFPRSIRLLIDNKYIFQPFWDHQAGRPEGENWEAQFSKAKAAANVALGKHDTASVLSIVLFRLYTLRNQLMHGGATWSGSTNRDQLRDAPRMMEKLVPAIIHIMMDASGEVWGDPVYPVVD